MSKKVVDHSPKSYKKVEDAIKMYHKYNKKIRVEEFLLKTDMVELYLWNQ